MNNLILVGKIISVPELITPRDINKVAKMMRFIIGVKRPFKNANGIYELDYINVKVWISLIEDIASLLIKDQMVSVKARVQSFQYKDNDNHYIEIIADQVVILCK